MHVERQPTREGQAFQKADLIQQALQTLREARGLDERDDLTAATWVAWYEATIPDVTDLKLLAGAMEVELVLRRGQRIIAEGERRGGDQQTAWSPSQKSKLPELGSLLSPAEEKKRHKARRLAREAPTVRAYVERKVKAGQVPTVNGALGAAKTARATRRPRGSEHRSTGPRLASIHRLYDAIARVADGERRSVKDLGKVARYTPKYFVELARVVPWVTLDSTADGIRLEIDRELRAICEAERSRPELAYQSVHQFLREFRAELTRKRKENHDRFRDSRWNPEGIIKRTQSDILDWIEDQLNRVPSL